MFARGMDSCNLLDLGFSGSKFTWQHPCRGGRLVSRRLDRGLGDTTWRMEFPKASIEHLVKWCSDHNPLLIQCSIIDPSRKERPCKFLAAWCEHVDYPMVVRNAWRKEQGDVGQALYNVRQESIRFNKETFGNIFANKKKLEAILMGIQ